MIYFTSDWHINEYRFNPNIWFRDFKTTKENNTYFENLLINNGFKNGDTLYYLGDVSVSVDSESTRVLSHIRNLFPESQFHLIVGNYDEDKIEYLKDFFDTIQQDKFIVLEGITFYLNHYPTKCREMGVPSICGHIHGNWRNQPNIINVGWDCWKKIVSEDEIIFLWKAMTKFYDEDVFPYGFKNQIK